MHGSVGRAVTAVYSSRSPLTTVTRLTTRCRGHTKYPSSLPPPTLSVRPARLAPLGTVSLDDVYDGLKLPRTLFSNALLCSVLGHDHGPARRHLALPEFVGLVYNVCTLENLQLTRWLCALYDTGGKGKLSKVLQRWHHGVLGWGVLGFGVGGGAGAGSGSGVGPVEVGR
jgi:hypothetical protein